MKTIPEILRAAAGTFESRNAEYGDAYKRTGAMLLAMFPEGGIPAITNADDAARLATLLMVAMKMQRYAHAFADGGHKDSAHDTIVYAAMLETMTNES